MKKQKKIKCVVWDLDNTLWNGVLLEGSCTGLKTGAREVIVELDNRGILHSIASKNEPEAAMAKLKEFEIAEYFIYPQVSWSPKSVAIREIADKINIHTNTLAFVDDQIFERDEVSMAIGDILCLDACELLNIPDMPEFQPRFITQDSKMRRKLYQESMIRQQVEAEFTGTHAEFLKQLEMVVTISPAEEGDLERAEELTVRTNQLNSTAVTYSYAELDAFRKSEDYLLYTAELKDKYGSHGKIGLMLMECKEERWILKLLLVSCRVMSYGMGSILLNYAIHQAKEHGGVQLFADFRPTDRNRVMYVTFKMAGFYESGQNGDILSLAKDMQDIQPYPRYIDLRIL